MARAIPALAARSRSSNHEVGIGGAFGRPRLQNQVVESRGGKRESESERGGLEPAAARDGPTWPRRSMCVCVCVRAGAEGPGIG